MEKKITTAQARHLAPRILELSRRRLAQEIPALTLPLYLFKDRPWDLPTAPCTDGCHLFYCPERLAADFLADRNAPARQLLHVLLHCLLGHLPQRRGLQYPALFDAVADYRIQSLMSRLLPDLQSSPDQTLFHGLFIWERPVRPQLDPDTSRPLPEVYRDIQKDRRLIRKFLNKGGACAVDDHSFWNPAMAVVALAGGKQQSGNGGQNNGGQPGFGRRQVKDGQRQTRGDVPLREGLGATGKNAETQSPDWDAVRENLAAQSRDNSWGSLPGALLELFDPMPDNDISYRDFLRRFAAPRERLLTDPDGLDHRWYCLGLELYGDIPLLEPPELSEPPAPDQLVIALDTSGSCGGETARRFLRETLNLLRDVSVGSSRFQVLLLQCDTQIQQEVLLESTDQVDALADTFAPRGFGGTDFRPVFQRVEQLRAERTLTKIQGLLYLSDACGDFPEAPPDYPTVFLIPQEEILLQPEIPPWITALYLDTDRFTVKEAEI